MIRNESIGNCLTDVKDCTPGVVYSIQWPRPTSGSAAAAPSQNSNLLAVLVDSPLPADRFDLQLPCTTRSVTLHTMCRTQIPAEAGCVQTKSLLQSPPCTWSYALGKRAVEKTETETHMRVLLTQHHELLCVALVTRLFQAPEVIVLPVLPQMRRHLDLLTQRAIRTSSSLSKYCKLLYIPVTSHKIQPQPQISILSADCSIHSPTGLALCYDWLTCYTWNCTRRQGFCR